MPGIVDLVDDDDVILRFGICEHERSVNSTGCAFTRFGVEHSLVRDRVITAGIGQAFPRMSDPA